VETVALPVIRDAVVFSDSDLIDIIRCGGPRKQAAAAGRDGISEPVADALIECGDETAAIALFRNARASIGEAGFSRAIDRFGGSERTLGAMIMRPQLPIGIAERLAVSVSHELGRLLVQRHALPDRLVADLVLHGREAAILRLGRGASAPDLLDMVARMHRQGRLTPSLIVRAVCMGDVAFFEAALATRAAIPVDNAQTLIQDPGRNGLAALCGKAGLPVALTPLLSAAMAMIAQTRFDGEPGELARYRARVLTGVLTQIETIDTADLDYLVDQLAAMLQAQRALAAPAAPAQALHALHDAAGYNAPQP
jgi:uncharacterized protein (DUF2336 family)